MILPKTNKIKSKDYIVIKPERLRDFCEGILLKAGLSLAHAHIVADSLIEANLRGIDTHGVVRLPIYTKRLKMGLVSANPEINLIRKNISLAILDGDNGPGQVAAMRGIEEAIKIARESGVGFVGIKNSNHFGTAGYFTMRAIEEDMIGIAMTHGEADMIPYGGRKPCLGTNPISVAIPAGEELPIVLDMASSIVAMGNIFLAREEGVPIPDGWAVDKEGNPTTDPHAARAVRPMGGAKGYGLSVVVDVLCGILTGSFFGLHIRNMYSSLSEPQALGQFVGAINIENFLSGAQFKKNIDQMIREIKSIPPDKGFEEVMLPGEPEWRAREKRLKEGIPIGERVYSQLKALGDEFNIKV